MGSSVQNASQHAAVRSLTVVEPPTGRAPAPALSNAFLSWKTLISLAKKRVARYKPKRIMIPWLLGRICTWGTWGTVTHSIDGVSPAGFHVRVDFSGTASFVIKAPYFADEDCALSLRSAASLKKTRGCMDSLHRSGCGVFHSRVSFHWLTDETHRAREGTGRRQLSHGYDLPHETGYLPTVGEVVLHGTTGFTFWSPSG